MSTVYHTPAAPIQPTQHATFEKRWQHIKPLLRLQFVTREDNSHLDALLEEARQYLWTVFTTEPERLCRKKRIVLEKRRIAFRNWKS